MKRVFAFSGVCVRRAIVRERIEPPKSRHGRREVRLPAAVAASLRDHLAAQPDRLAFPSEAGGPLDPGNLRRRVLKPPAAEAGAPWAGFHTSATPSPRSTLARAPTSSN